MTPLAAIRAECLVCMGGSRLLVSNCQSTKCSLWHYRFGRKPTGRDHRPLRAIRSHCLECVGTAKEVNNCTGRMLDGSSCTLHPFRFGHNPAKRHGRKPIVPIQEALQARSHGRLVASESPIPPREEV